MNHALTMFDKLFLDHFGPIGFLLLLLALSFIANWAQYLQRKLLKQRLELQKEEKLSVIDRAASGQELLMLIETSLATRRFPRLFPSTLARSLRTILLVEDEQSIHYYKEGIEETFPDTEVRSANNGAQAWAEIVKKRPCLVITDLVMPIMNGYQLLKRLASQYPQIPVLVVSAYADNLAQIAAEVTALPSRVEFLPKPIELELLLRSISKLIGTKKEQEDHDSAAA